METIYISGPMSGYPNKNYDAFNQAAEALRGKGFRVLNPAEPPDVEGWEWVDYMRRDVIMLMEADGVATLPDAHRSKGARIEINLAKELGMSVVPIERLLLPQAGAANV